MSMEYLLVMRRVLDHFGFRAATILGPKSDRMENIVYKKIKFKYPRAPDTEVCRDYKITHEFELLT